MTRWSGLFRGFVFAAAILAATMSADSASAWCWRGGYRFGWRPFCGPRYSYSYSYGYSGCFAPAWSPAWNWCGPRVFSYSCYTPYVYGCYPYSYNLGCSPYWGWNGWGCGPFAYNPVCLPSSFAPVYGPAGVFPYLGLASNETVAQPAAVVTSTPPRPLVLASAAREAPAFPTPAGRVSGTTIVRASSTEARMRAGKLVAIGDQHMQAAIGDRGRLPKALDAYKRAATIAADQPDTFLRQAIALAAMDREEASDAAVARAVAIDARLGDDPRAARDAAKRLPPDPVFGDRPAGGPTVLAARTGGLLARIFRDEAGIAGDDGNWIAARWNARFGGPEARLAAK
jgi:hypothetical protein